MRLTSFIQEHKEQIAEEWVSYARENIDISSKMGLPAVRDHIIEMLDRIVEDMNTGQTDDQQTAKSKGHKPPVLRHDMPAREHGLQRVEAGFDVVELSSEFRALRASVLRLWEKEMTSPMDIEQVQDMIRFNEAIDEAWMHSMARFHTKVDEGKNWLIGVLGHDLRSPLTTISSAQQILARSSNLSDDEKGLVKRSEASLKRMEELINNLLELTSLQLGSGMTINKAPIDLTLQSEQIVQEFTVAYPLASFRLQSPGPVQGDWDRVRINQVLTNLITNALRHGRPGGPVTVTISAKDGNAVLSVHNEGNPIPEIIRNNLFSKSYRKKRQEHKKRDSYGLGLYIVKEIVDGHKGRIFLESTVEKGTTFSIILPRTAENN